jgi:hypothetical protein
MRLTVVLAPLLVAVSSLAVGPTYINAVAAPVNGAAELLIPIAGNAPGANGTFFHSDITLVTLANEDQLVEVRWLPAGGAAGTTTRLTMPLGNEVRSEDFVAEYLRVEGVGSIVVRAITSTGAVDPTARMYASARIWTRQPGTDGTSSQTVDVVPLSVAPIATAAVFGVRRDERFRLNAGIINLDPVNEATFLVGDIYVPPTPVIGEFYLVTVAPMSMQQIPLAGRTSPRTNIHIRLNSFTPVAWVAYGSSVDNVTGGGWTQVALPMQ